MKKLSSASLPNGLWPSDDLSHIIASHDPVTGVWKHAAVTCADGAIWHMPPNKNHFFACAEFSSPTRRSVEAAVRASGFWTEVDCGPTKAANGDGYVDEATGARASAHFCWVTGLPAPTHEVSSGGGRHLYWRLDRPIDKLAWQRHARQLKDLAKCLDFRADPSRTADIASLMRMPGTLNHKYDPPRPVELIHAAPEPLSTEAFLAALEAAHARFCGNDRQRSRDASGDVDRPSMTLDALADLLSKISPDVGYGDWLTALMAVHTETAGSDEGFRLAMDWSSGGATFPGEAAMRRKWRTFRKDAPRKVTAGSLIYLARQQGARHAV